MKYRPIIRFGLLAVLLVLCTYFAPTAIAQDAATASVVELPVDSTLGTTIGVYLRHLEVHYPPNTKLSLFQRIYSKGTLDTTRSSIQVHARTTTDPQMYIDLGFSIPTRSRGLKQDE